MTVKCAKLLRVGKLTLQRYLQKSQHAASFHSDTSLQSLLAPSEKPDPKREPKLSYRCEISPIPLVNWTYGKCLSRTAKDFPDKIAYTFEHFNRSFTFAEFQNEVENCAKGLLSAGFKKGDALLIFAPNIINWLVMFIACSKIGVLSASVHPAYTKSELFNALDKVKPKAIFIPDEFKPLKFYENLCKWIPEIATSAPGQLNSSRHPSVKMIIIDSEKSVPGTVNMKDILQGGRVNLQEAEAKVGCDDPLTVVFTSGTTGAAKAAALSHHGFVNNVYSVNNLWADPEMTPEIANPLPLFHVFGLMVSTFPLIGSERVIFPAVGYDQIALMRCIEKYKCSRLAGSPTMYVDLINHPERQNFDLSSLKYCTMGGAICTPEMRKMVENNFGCTTLTGYGATETSTVCSIIRPDDPTEKRLKTVGRPLPHVELKIADPETGTEVPCNETGEVWIRGFNIFSGYIGDEEKTKDVITSARWYRSGDVGVMDEDGFVNIVGRLKDLIIRGGENIHPIDIENELDKHPAVEESHVIAVPDQRMGEEICAVVVLREGFEVSPEELKEFLKEKIAYFKMPKYFLFEHDVPKTSIGKPQKNKLRKTASEKLGLV